MPRQLTAAVTGTAPRRVAFILPSFAGGGAERVLLTFAAALDPSAFSHEVFVLDGTGPWRNMVPAQIPVNDFAKKRIRTALPPLVRALHRYRADIAISTIGALNLALLAAAPLLPGRVRLVVREANTPHRHATGGVSRRFYRFAYPRLYRRADRVIVPASYLARVLSEDFDVPPAKISVLHNPVDEAALRATARDPIRVPGQGPRFVAVGRLTRQKGFDRLLAMLPTASSDTHLTILGEGPERAALEAQRYQLGLTGRVEIPGFAIDAARYIAGADALLLPSRWEGLPNVALEALALGTPVIATPDAGGIREIAELAPPGSVTVAAPGRRFVAAMDNVHTSSLNRQKASLLAAEFRLRAAADRFQQLIASVLEARRCS